MKLSSRQVFLVDPNCWVKADTKRKTSVNPRRSSSSTIIPLKASDEAVPTDQSQMVLTAPANSPTSEMLPVIQRCVGRANASTSITTTAAAQTMTSGAINAQLMIGIIDCAKSEFILYKMTDFKIYL
jgi:hypothetical protein